MPNKREVELNISTDTDANINEKDLVQSNPEIDEDSGGETLWRGLGTQNSGTQG